MNVKGNLRSTLDKLKGVKADLVRRNEGWRDWDFKDLLRELKKWTDINHVAESIAEKISVNGNSNLKQTKPTRVLKTHSQQETRTGNQQCIHCDDQNHRSVNCTKITEMGERCRILSEKKLCFNCTGGRYRVDECKSRLRCQKCCRKHHTSICSTREKEFNPLLIATGMPNARVTYPAEVVEVEGVKCRALLDTGAVSSYASAVLLNRISTRNCAKEIGKTEMLLGRPTQEVEMVTIEIGDVNGKFTMPVEVTKVDKEELLSLDNPNYEETIAKNLHLSGVVMNDQDSYSSVSYSRCRRVCKIENRECTKNWRTW